MAKDVKTVANLARLIAQEEGAVKELRRKREQIAAELDALASVIAQLKGETGRKEGARTATARKKTVRKKIRRRVSQKRGAKSLQQAVTEILSKSGKPMRAGEVAGQLSEVGYKTRSKNPKNMISAVLGQSPQFTRVRTGVYTIEKP